MAINVNPRKHTGVGSLANCNPQTLAHIPITSKLNRKGKHAPCTMVNDGLKRGLSFCFSAMSLLMRSRMLLAMEVPSIFAATMIVEENEVRCR